MTPRSQERSVGGDTQPSVLFDQHGNPIPVSAFAHDSEEKKPKEEGEKVDDIRADTGDEILRVFEGSGRIGGKEHARETKSVYVDLHRFAQRLKLLATVNDQTAQAKLIRDLRAYLTQTQRSALLRRSDLPQPVREILAENAGRKTFRLKVFNELCEQGKLDLSRGDRLHAAMSDEEVEAHMKKRLGKYWGVFDHQCSFYDFGTARRGYEAILRQAEGQVSESFTDRVRTRALERAGLADEIIRRNIHGEIGDTYAVAEKSTGMSKFLGEGGDIYLKYTAFGLLLSNPVMAAALWSARGITEAAGYDFGQVLGKAAKTPFRLIGKGGKWLLSSLPEKHKKRMPKFAQEWLQSPAPPAFEKLDRASLTVGQRAQVFFRGLVPFGGAGIDAARHGVYGMKKAKRAVDIRRAKSAKKPGPKGKIKAPMPVERLRVDALAAKQREDAENTVHAACKSVIASMSPTPAPTTAPTTAAKA